MGFCSKIGSRFFFSAAPFAWLGMLVLSGCEPSVEQACRDFQGVQGEITVAIKTMREQVSLGRRLASLDEDREAKRQYWLTWTEGVLKKNQRSQDALSFRYERSDAVQSLNEAALLLTTLHGLFEQEKWAKASATLVQLQAKYVQAAEVGCFGPKSAE